MGRKRKVETGNSSTTVANNEDIAANPCPKTIGMENIFSHADHKTNAMKAVNVETSVHPDSNDFVQKRKTPKSNGAVLRQSGRLKSSAFIGGSKKVEPVVKHVNLVESEMEEAQQVRTLPIPTERNLEREVPQIQQLNSLKAVYGRNLAEKQNTRRPNDGISTDLCYKSLYFDAQKQIDELKGDHYELLRKLDFARGKIEVYEKMLIGTGAPKVVIPVSSLQKATTEATISLSPQTCIPPTDDAALGADNDSKIISKGKEKNRKSTPDATDGHMTSPKQRKSYRKKNG